MERRADDAERELLQWKKVRFMANKVGDEYSGYITGVAPFGLFVELVEHYVEGLVHVSSMADDYYRFVEQEHVLRGEHTKKIYRLGDRVDVQVVRVDMERRQVDLGLVEILEHVRRDEGGAPDSKPGQTEERTPANAAAGKARTPRQDTPSSLGLLRPFGSFLRRFLEVLDTSANPAPNLRQTIGAKDQDDDTEDDQKFGDAKIAHRLLPAQIVARWRSHSVCHVHGLGRYRRGGRFPAAACAVLYRRAARRSVCHGHRRQGGPGDRPDAGGFRGRGRREAQEIAAFAAGVPVDGRARNRAWSMAGEPLRLAKAASKAFLNQLRPTDRSMAVAIGNDAEVIAPLSNDHVQQQRAIDVLDPWSTTSLHDAIISILDRVEGRRDGWPSSSSRTVWTVIALRPPRVVERARQSQALIYPITLGRERPPLAAELAVVSGGRSFLIKDARALDETFTTIARELRYQYLLGYTPMKPGQSGAHQWRSIRVRVKRATRASRARARQVHRGMTTHPLVAGLFASADSAITAARALRAMGVPHEAVSIVARTHDECRPRIWRLPGSELEDSVTAARIGEIGAHLVSAVALVLPGIGPIVADGPLAAGLAEAAGHVAGGIARTGTGGGSTGRSGRLESRIKAGALLVGAHVTAATTVEARNTIINSGAERVVTVEWTD